MIGRTLSFTGSKFGIKNETNKQNKKYFLAKTNFFQLRKIFTREYITHFFLHASGTYSGTSGTYSGTLPARPALAESVTFIHAFFQKIRGAGFDIF